MQRGNAYSEKSLEENEMLILACNDSFLDLFYIMSHNILNMDKLKALPKPMQDLIIQFTYFLMIILTLYNSYKQYEASDFINFDRFYEDYQYTSQINIITRIQDTYAIWDKQKIFKNFPYQLQ